jgi:hypothetical protein
VGQVIEMLQQSADPVVLKVCRVLQPPMKMEEIESTKTATEKSANYYKYHAPSSHHQLLGSPVRFIPPTGRDTWYAR